MIGEVSRFGGCFLGLPERPSTRGALVASSGVRRRPWRTRHNGSVSVSPEYSKAQAPSPGPASRSRSRWIDFLVAIVIAALFASSAPWWWHALFDRHGRAGASSSAVVGFSGGCATYQLFAQNRWRPVGAAIRDAPNVLSTQNGSFPPNMSVAVNGWVHGRAAYPTNVAPFNSDVWFHLADGAGWVSFGAVRASPTAFDPTGVAAGGPAAATPAQCEGAVQ